MWMKTSREVAPDWQGWEPGTAVSVVPSGGERPRAVQQQRADGRERPKSFSEPAWPRIHRKAPECNSQSAQGKASPPSSPVSLDLHVRVMTGTHDWCGPQPDRAQQPWWEKTTALLRGCSWCPAPPRLLPCSPSWTLGPTAPSLSHPVLPMAWITLSLGGFCGLQYLKVCKHHNFKTNHLVACPPYYGKVHRVRAAGSQWISVRSPLSITTWGESKVKGFAAPKLLGGTWLLLISYCWKCTIPRLLCQTLSPSPCLLGHPKWRSSFPLLPPAPCFISFTPYILLNRLVCETAFYASLIIARTPKEHRHFFIIFEFPPTSITVPLWESRGLIHIHCS